MKNLRLTPCSSIPKLRNTEPPFSNFDFIESTFGLCRPLHRILSLARMSNFSTMILEEIENVGYSK